MFLLTRHERKAWRTRLNRKRITRLAEVQTTPTRRETGIVISIMLTTKPDPQRGEKISAHYADYLRPWWTTVNRVGLSGVVLHDGLPEVFTNSATTDHVHFCQVEPGEWPILHDRHRLCRDYLLECEAPFVFVTDLSDVAFKHDPFSLIEQDQDNHRIFLGSEEKRIGESRCLRQEMTTQFGSVLHADRQVINPGIIGGKRTEVIELLNHIIDCISGQSQLVKSVLSLVKKVVH